MPNAKIDNDSRHKSSTANGQTLRASKKNMSPRRRWMRNYEVNYYAQAQVDRLSPAERRELLNLEMMMTTTTKVAPSGNSVTILGSSKRVVWKRSETGRPVILSVINGEQNV